MIIVETPLKTLQREIDKLTPLGGRDSQLFAKGAVAALTWIVSGGPPPSEWEYFPETRVEPGKAHC